MTSRILLYAHDGKGLGHVVRMAAIGEAISKLEPSIDVLAISGERLLSQFFPKACDCIKLPSYVTIQERNEFKTDSKLKSVGTKELTELRQSLLNQIIRQYKPNVVLVDFFPMGKRDELANAIRELADLGSHVHIALGLRGIVDSPQFALQDNLSKKNQTFINNYYHSIFVYGNPQFYNFVENYSLHHFENKIIYTDFVVRPSLMEYPCILGKDCSEGIRLLVGLGSGYRIEGIINHLISGLMLLQMDRSIKVKIVCGPRFEGVVKRIQKNQNNIEIIDETVRMPELYAWATHFVGAGGSNTVLEVLYSKLPSLIIARNFIEKEQEVFLNRWMKISGLHWIRESELSAELIFSELHNLLKRKRVNIPDWVCFDGATNCAKKLIQFCDKNI